MTEDANQLAPAIAPEPETPLHATRQLLDHARAQLTRVIAGQTHVIDEALIALLCQGHVLLEGVPGIAKTLIVKALGRLLGLEFHRVQATPDLMPADILGTTILVQGSSTFTFHEGAVFTDLLLVDEINRMPPRTQAALLECMEERQVTTDGVRRPLPNDFTVFATQNPVDFEGTYPLPEAQLDRFLLKTVVSYPTESEERHILELHLASSGALLLDSANIEPIPAGLLSAARAEVQSIRIEPELLTYILALVRRTREWPTLTLGASPRAALSLMRVAQAVAALEDRSYIVPDDVKRALPPVLRHRIRLKPEAELEGFDPDRILADILAAAPVPAREIRHLIVILSKAKEPLLPSPFSFQSSRPATMIQPSLHPAPITAAAQPRGRFAFGLTPRALWLLAAGFLALIPGYRHPQLAYAMLLWDAILLLAALLDGLRLPPPLTLTASRSWLSAPSLGNRVEIELTLTHPNEILLDCTLTDDLPPELLETPAIHTLRAYPRQPASVRYSLQPRERGDVHAGDLYIRYRSALGLVSRWSVAPLAQPARIYPELRSAEEQSLFLAKSRKIDLQLRQMRYRGLGREFESLREYRPGDDLRDVCWTASARRGDLVTRQFQAERSQSVWIVLDTGRLMRARVKDGPHTHTSHSHSSSYTKLDYACSTAVALAQLAQFSGDKVGLLGYGRRIQQQLLPGRGAGQMRQFLESLAQLQAEPSESDHLRATAILGRLQPRRGLILWITDLAESAMRPEVIDGAAQLLHRHVVLFVAMAQPEVAAIARAIPQNVEEMFRSAAAQEMASRRELLLARLRDQGAIALDTLPSQMTASVLNNYLSIKERAVL